MLVKSWFKRHFGRTLVATQCGHETKLVGQVSAFNRKTTLTIHPPKGEKPGYCHSCLGLMSIRCAWCGEPIFIGDPITLYTPTESNFKIPDHAVVHKQDPLQLVGCLGWDCALSGIDRAGFWVPRDDGKGCVRQVPSPLEIILNAKTTQNVVIIDDLTSMGKAGKPRLVHLREEGR